MKRFISIESINNVKSMNQMERRRRIKRINMIIRFKFKKRKWDGGRPPQVLISVMIIFL